MECLCICRCLENIHNNLKSISLPLLVVHGENDSLCQPAGSHLLVREARSRDKKIKVYPGASHHLILEVRQSSGLATFFQRIKMQERQTREEVVLDITAWIKQRIGGKSKEKITTL